MSLVPDNREWQFMQQLRDLGWVRAVELPDSHITLEHLLATPGIESRGAGKDTAYRITDEGMAAKKAPVRFMVFEEMIRWRWAQRFSPTKGHGFIRPDDNEIDVFVHVWVV